jgi:trehalose synthase-fused probable maltokinase
VTGVDERELIDFVTRQRWFGAKSRDVTHATVIDSAVLREAEPRLTDALVEMRFDTGTHDTYQLLFGERVGDISLDALEDPAHVRELVHLIRGGGTVPAGEGTVSFSRVEGFADLGRELQSTRRIETEQSNTSLVFDDELILKVFRRLEPGINPELELLRFLTVHGFENIAPLAGWYAYSGRPMEATLGVLQRFVPHAEDGWELALAELARDPDGFVERLRRLAEVTARMHTVLGSDPGDPAFCAEEPSAESLALLTASVDEEIERLFLDLPESEELAPIAGRAEEVRERVRQLTHVGPIGRVIRHHGDFHLGQTLWADDDWVLIDFEGEPARSLAERRRKRSPLRDVAGMLRSFAYVASASALVRGVAPPEGWEERARSAFVDEYLAHVDSNLVPPSRSSVDRLLEVFELEKAVYELRYELNNRPEWVRIPVAGIARLLDGQTGE